MIQFKRLNDQATLPTRATPGSALTMEFHNTLHYHTPALEPGDKCGQMYFFRGEVVPELASYAVKGQYNADTSVQASRGVR